MLHQLRLVFLILLVCTLVAGCGRRRNTSGIDGGPGVDSGSADAGGGTDAGPLPDGSIADAGRRDAASTGICSCVPLTTYPLVNCSIGSTRCTGCLGLDDFCDDMPTCLNECTGEFTCVGGKVMIGSSMVEDCTTCPSCSGLCMLVCGAGG